MISNLKNKISKGQILAITIVTSLVLDYKMSSDLLCLNYWYKGIKYSLLILLFCFFYYFLKKTIETRILVSFIIWFVLDCAVFYCIYTSSQSNGFFVTTCPVSSYVKTGGKSSPYLVYYYKGVKQFLQYQNQQLDSLHSSGNYNPEEKIELRLNLSEFCPSIYYMNDFEVIVKDR